MASEVQWVDILSALLTPTIAIGGLTIAFLQWRTNEKKRQQELFDRRYAFYERITSWWLSTGEEGVQEPDGEDLIPWAEKADFLFGEDVSKHIMSLEYKSHTGSPLFANSDFSRPFYKYLRLR